MSEILEQWTITSKVHFTVWDDYAIMSMVESEQGISILPKIILRRPLPHRRKGTESAAYRKIGLAMRDKKTASLAVKRFLEYPPRRNG